MLGARHPAGATSQQLVANKTRHIKAQLVNLKVQGRSLILPAVDEINFNTQFYSLLMSTLQPLLMMSWAKVYLANWLSVHDFDLFYHSYKNAA